MQNSYSAGQNTSHLLSNACSPTDKSHPFDRNPRFGQYNSTHSNQNHVRSLTHLPPVLLDPLDQSRLQDDQVRFYESIISKMSEEIQRLMINRQELQKYENLHKHMEKMQMNANSEKVALNQR